MSWTTCRRARSRTSPPLAPSMSARSSSTTWTSASPSWPTCSVACDRRSRCTSPSRRRVLRPVCCRPRSGDSEPARRRRGRRDDQGGRRPRRRRLLRRGAPPGATDQGGHARVPGVQRDDRPALGGRPAALYRERHSLEYTALALAGVYGTRQRANGGVVAAFVAARQAGRPAEIHGTGRQAQDFVAVDDAVDALVRATTAGRVSSSMSAPVCRRRSPRCISRCWVCRWRRRCGSRRAGEVERLRCHRSGPASTWPGRRGPTWPRASGSCWPSWRPRRRLRPGPPAERSGGELADGVAGADGAALDDAGVDPAEVELPPDR